jgi:hypothetical protein
MNIQKKSKRLTKEKKEAVEDTKQENGSYIAIYGSRETFIESRPTTTRVEFGCGPIKRSSASSTLINSLTKELVIFSCARIPV